MLECEREFRQYYTLAQAPQIKAFINLGMIMALVRLAKPALDAASGSWDSVPWLCKIGHIVENVALTALCVYVRLFGFKRSAGRTMPPSTVWWHLVYFILTMFAWLVRARAHERTSSLTPSRIVRRARADLFISRHPSRSNRLLGFPPPSETHPGLPGVRRGHSRASDRGVRRLRPGGVLAPAPSRGDRQPRHGIPLVLGCALHLWPREAAVALPPVSHRRRDADRDHRGARTESQARVRVRARDECRRGRQPGRAGAEVEVAPGIRHVLAGEVEELERAILRRRGATARGLNDHREREIDAGCTMN